MAETLAIRAATAADAPAISALVLSLARYFLADPERPGDAEAFFQTISPEAIAGYIESGRFRYHLADAGGELAGVVAIRDGAHLYHLFIAERFHGRGVATRLWERARAEALAGGNPGRFTVNSSLFAVPLYEHLGFTASGPALTKDGIAYQPMEL
jgi:GNAT superfamily N-acetyltransferase